MTLQIIIGVLLLAALVYAWYTERTRRREAELERDVATRRTTLDGIAKKLDEGKPGYDKAASELDAATIPPHLLDLVGAPTVVTDLTGGTKVDLVTGERFAKRDPRFHRPGLDPDPSGETGGTH